MHRTSIGMSVSEMKAFVKFYHYLDQRWDSSSSKLVKTGPYLVACTGSDAIFILDGRNKLVTWRKDAARRIEQLKAVKRIDAFEIRVGDLRKNRTVYRSQEDWK